MRKITNRFWTLAMLLALGLLSAGCGGGQADAGLELSGPELSETQIELPDAGANLDLPPPSELKTVSEPPTEYNLFCPAQWPTITAPSDNIGLDMPDAKSGSGYYQYTTMAFNPNWDDDGTDRLKNAAYATYSFYAVEEFAGSPKVTASWETLPAGARCYIGLPHYASDRWRWFAANANGTADVGSFEGCFDQLGTLHVVVLLLADQSANLEFLYMGDPFEPFADLSSDYYAGDPSAITAPLTVTWGSYYCQALDNEITLIEYDFQGDGIYDEVDDGDRTTQYTYTEPGFVTCKLRVTDSLGRMGYHEKTIRVVDPLNTPPIAAVTATETSGDAPLALTFDASTSTDNDVIVLYEWDLDNDGQFELNTASEPTYNTVLGMRGLNTVTVRVTDSDYATATASVDVSVTAGWRSVLIDEGSVSTVNRIGMCVTGSGVNSRACMSWYDFADSRLYFARATEENGSNWTMPVNVVPGSSSHGHSLSLITNPASGMPIISYGKENLDNGDRSLHFVRASSADGSGWFDPVSVSSEANIGALTSMTFVDGRPVIAAVRNFLTDFPTSVVYFRAADVNGNTWNESIEIVPAREEGDFNNIDLMAVGTGLVMGCNLTNQPFGQSDALELYHSPNSDGSGWALAGSFDLVGNIIDLEEIDGQPAVFAGTSYGNSIGMFARAENGAGSSWPATGYVFGPADIGGAGGVAMVGNLPMVCFRSFDSSDLWVSTAKNSAGSDWDAPYQIDTVGTTGECCEIVSVNGLPVIGYYDSAEGAVKAAWWQD